MRPIVLVVLLLALPLPARATFHLSRVSEVMSGKDGDAHVQFVEIEMEAPGQGFVGGTRLTRFNCDFSACSVLLQLPPDPSGLDQQSTGAHWLMASPDDTTFFAATAAHADFYWNDAVSGAVDPGCGMVCWGAPGTDAGDPSAWDPGDPDNYVDCVAYGGYVGRTKTSTHDGTPPSGTPTNLIPGTGSQSLTRVHDAGDNMTDFALLGPTPTKNAGPTGTNVGGPFGACTPRTIATTTTTTSPAVTTTTLGAPGVDVPLRGKRLVLKDDPTDPRKRRLLLVSHDRSITIGAGNDSSDDPTREGGTLRVRTTGGCGADGSAPCDDTYVLVGTGWSLVGKRGANRGYRYASRSGPVRSAAVTAGKSHVVMAKARGVGLGHALAADPAPVDVVLGTGTKRYCLRFATGAFKVGKRFAAASAPAPAACPP